MQFYLLWWDRETRKRYFQENETVLREFDTSPAYTIGLLPFFDEFTILAHGNKKYLMAIKKILLIKRDQPVLNTNISFARFHLLYTV